MTVAGGKAIRRRVLIDGRFFGKPGGFGRYIEEFVCALGAANQPDMSFMVAVPGRANGLELPVFPNLTWHKLPDINFVLWEQIMIPYLAHRLHCELIHFPNNTQAIFTGGLSSVVTIHDIIFLTEPVRDRSLRYQIVNLYSKLIFRLATAKSRGIVSISNTTKSTLENIGYKSVVIYNTVDGLIAKAQPKSPRSPKSYILHRGGYQVHRNTELVIRAFRIARVALPGIVLKIFGVPGGADRWNVTEDDGIEFLPKISDAEVARLYQDSGCVVAASLQEGFGLPILEGFGFGAPVITSNRDPMREIAADAALLVDPTDVHAIARAMVSVMTNPDLAEALVAKGRSRMGEFSSTKIAERMLQVYRSCLTPQKSVVQTAPRFGVTQKFIDQDRDLRPF